MVTLSDLITGNISDSPADREAAPFLLLLTFPVVVPASLVYHTVKGIEYIKNFYTYRKKSLELMKNGINPITILPDSDTDASIKWENRMEVYYMNLLEKHQIVKDTERLLEEEKQENPILDDNYSSIKLVNSKRKKIKVVLKDDYKPKKLSLTLDNKKM